MEDREEERGEKGDLWRGALLEDGWFDFIAGEGAKREKSPRRRACGGGFRGRCGIRFGGWGKV